jgi:hypothetical protein
LIFKDFNNLTLFVLSFFFTFYKTVYKIYITYYYIYTFFLSFYIVKTKNKTVIIIINKTKYYIFSILVLI